MTEALNDFGLAANYIIMIFGAAILARYLLAEYVAGRLELDPWMRCQGAQRHRIGVAVMTFLLGLVIRRIPWWPIELFGQAVTAVGFLCFIRVITPDDWGRWQEHAWKICGIVALVLAGAWEAWRLG